MAEFLYDHYFLVVFSLTAIIVYIIVRVSINNSNKAEASVKDLVTSSYPDAMHLHSSSVTEQAFAISNAAQCVVIARNRSLTTIPYSELAGVEVVVNGGTVASTSTSEVVGRAIVGGVVGALTAKRVTSKTAYDVHINIRTSNIYYPTVRFDLLNYETEYFDKEVEQATECANVIKLLIDQNATTAQNAVPEAPVASTTAEPQTPTHPQPVSIAGISVADELRKLADLHASGILTDAEFQDQKQRLLSQNN